MNIEQNKADKSFKIIGEWAPQSKLLKEKFPQLDASDLQFEPGKEEELLERIETRLNKKREEVINIVKKGMPEKAL